MYTRHYGHVHSQFVFSDTYSFDFCALVVLRVERQNASYNVFFLHVYACSTVQAMQRYTFFSTSLPRQIHKNAVWDIFCVFSAIASPTFQPLPLRGGFFTSSRTEKTRFTLRCLIYIKKDVPLLHFFHQLRHSICKNALPLHQKTGNNGSPHGKDFGNDRKI